MVIHPLNHRNRRFALPSLPPLAIDPLPAGLRRLDDGYHYFRRVRASGGLVDAVVVGPGGTWALTRAHDSGRFRMRNGHWYRWNRSTESWIPWSAEPILAARMAGHRLEMVLDAAGVPAEVEACLIRPASMTIELDEGQRPGLHIEADLASLAARIAHDEVLTPAQVDRIVALLDPRQPLPRLATSSPQG